MQDLTQTALYKFGLKLRDEMVKQLANDAVCPGMIFLAMAVAEGLEELARKAELNGIAGRCHAA